MNHHKSMEKRLRDKERKMRILEIRKNLHRGDINAVASRALVSREWVSRVLSGAYVSEKVLRAAEELISERNAAKQGRI